MALIKKHESSFLAMVVVVMISTTIASEPAHPHLNPFCTDYTDTSLCSAVLGGAKTWEQGMDVALKGALTRANQGKALALEALEKELPSKDKAQVLETCRESYEDAIEGLEKSQELVKNDPTLALNSQLSSVYTAYSDCIDMLSPENGQSHIPPQVSDFHDAIKNLVDLCLAMSNKDPRLTEYNKSLETSENVNTGSD